MSYSTLDTPNYRVLQVIEVTPEVVTSSIDDDENEDAGQGPAAAPKARSLPPPAEPPLPEDPRIVAMLRAPISRREYKFTGQYIYVNYERFMRSVDPNWVPPPWLTGHETAEDSAQEEARRYPSSCLYTSTSNRQGPVSCSERMSKWLAELPVAKSSIEAAQSSSFKLQDRQTRGGGGAEGSRSHNGILAELPRPRAHSTPVPFSISSNHLMGDHEYCLGQSNPGVPTAPAAGPTTKVPGGFVIPGPHHPNPLGQHPIVLQELPIQLRIPKRKSSLRNNFQICHVDFQPPAPSTTPAADNLIRGIDSIQLDLELRDSAVDLQVDPKVDLSRRNTVACPRLLPRLRGHRNNTAHTQLRFQLDTQLQNSTLHPGSELDHDTFMGDAPPQCYDNANEAHDLAAQRRFSVHVHQLFGQDSGKVNHKKHARSETPVTMEDQRPTKRIRGAIDMARHRLSMRGMPAIADDSIDGRQSRLGRIASTAAKRMSLPVLAGHSIVKVPPFNSYTKYERITIGFIGDNGCGKTSLVQRYSTGYHDTENPAREYKDGYAVETSYIEVDSDPVRLELWDVSSECNFLTAQDHCRPLTTANYDLIVVCFDIADNETLKSATAKWRHKVELYCGSPPIMLVGLRQDLRKSCPTLRLLHLDEPECTTIGDGEEKAREMGAKAYYECSAATGEGVTDVIHGAIRMALERRRQAKPPTKIRKLLKKVKKAKKEFKMFRN